MEIIVNQDHIAEFYRFNKDLAAFILEDTSTEKTPEISLTRLMGNVAQYCLHYMDTTKEPLPADLVESQRIQSESADAPKCRELTLPELAYDRYAQFIETRVPPEVRKAGLAPVGPVSPAIQEKAAQACNLPVHEIPEPRDEDNLVTVAWLTARKNKIRAWQRIGAVMFLAHQTPASMSLDVRAELEKEGQDAIDYLYRRVEAFTAAELKFAILLGESALEQTRKELIEDVLKPDGALGRHLFKDERPAESFHIYRATQSLREDLEKLEPSA